MTSTGTWVTAGAAICLNKTLIKEFVPITLTEPRMTRFIMSLEEAVDLVLFAFENGYEAHKQYLDIQCTLRGLERIACLPIEKLIETKPYSEDGDFALYTSSIQPQEMTIGEGYFAIFYPQDGHMPQLCANEPVQVKKVVVKVKFRASSTL